MQKKSLLPLSIFFCFLLSSSVFAAQEVPKKGDVIQLLIGGYEIQAQVVSITAPSSPGPEQTKKAEQATSATSEPADTKDQQEESKTANLQEQYNSFAESNPVKTGIEQFQNTVNDQVAKWYQLVSNKTNLPKTAAITNTKIDPRALFAGLAVVGALILFWLFKRSRKRRYNYDDDDTSEDE